MHLKKIMVITLCAGLAGFNAVALAADKIDRSKESTTEGNAYLLEYAEREPGVDEYEVTVTVTPEFIRIDDDSDKSGYIVYDDKKREVYSVSHQDKSVLVIKHHDFSADKSPAKRTIEYLALSDAPEVDGKQVYNYRVHPANNEDETCTELQVVEGLLPEVTAVLKRYQQVVSGQQVDLTDNRINDIQTVCYYIDEIYNDGAYYDKGLPIQEWHSNEHSKILLSYKKTTVKPDFFKAPDNYRRFSITEEDMKSPG